MTCPYCDRPIDGAHHIAADGSAWHLSCAERAIEERADEQPVRDDDATEVLL